MKISATIITLNEEHNLPRALERLDFCDEVLVVDSGSNDQTANIARAAGARVLENAWPGYADQKNFAAAHASHNWILSLDADEALSSELAAEIVRLHAESDLPYDAYRFPRRARYLGAWIRHSGWYPDSKIRLYDRRKARWVGDYVHESVVADGPVGKLRGDLLHYTCNDFADHIRTVNRYTTLAAREWRDNHGPIPRGQVPAWRLFAAPPWAFLRSFILQRGFLDGRRGFLIAWMAAFYVFAKYAKARFAPDSACPGP